MSDKTWNALYTLVFTLLISVMSIIYCNDMEMEINAGMDEILSGKAAKEIEDRLDNRFSLKQLGVNTWAAIQYLAFNEGKKGLTIGDNDWLFTDEEIYSLPNAKYNLASNISYISQVKQVLAQRGITLVVLPVPAKLRVNQDSSVLPQRDATMEKLYELFITELKQDAIDVVDPLSEMQARSEKSELFLPTDTHWTPLGAEIAAQNVAKYINEHLQLSLEEKKFVTDVTGTSKHEGDLMNFLPLSPWADFLSPKEVELTLYETRELATTDELDSLFADSNETIDTVLIGTSYSANEKWNFPGALKQALSTDIVNLSVEGKGPFLPMADFINDYLDQLDGLKLVIWEIPERYTQFAYNVPAPGNESLNLLAMK